MGGGGSTTQLGNLDLVSCNASMFKQSSIDVIVKEAIPNCSLLDDNETDAPDLKGIAKQLVAHYCSTQSIFLLNFT